MQVQCVGCPTFLSAVVLSTVTKSSMGRRRLVWLPRPGGIPSRREIRAGTQARNLEAGTEAEAMEEQ